MLTVADFLAGAAAIAAIAGPAVTYGMLKGKVKELDAKIGNLATKESVGAVEGRVHTLEADMREAREAIATIPKLDEKLQGMKELVTVQLDELKHGMREVRSFLSPATPGRSRKLPPN